MSAYACVSHILGPRKNSDFLFIYLLTYLTIHAYAERVDVLINKGVLFKRMIYANSLDGSHILDTLVNSYSYTV